MACPVSRAAFSAVVLAMGSGMETRPACKAFLAGIWAVGYRNPTFQLRKAAPRGL
jgi:hypothetical protein